MTRAKTISILLMTLVFFTSFNLFKPSEKDLVGFWKVDQYLKSNETQPIEGLNISLQCSVEGDMGKFTGINGKNIFSGLYEIKSKKEISLKGLMTTKYDESDISKSFIESFQKVSKFKLEDDKLLLMNDESNSIIVLKKEK